MRVLDLINLLENVNDLDAFIDALKKLPTDYLIVCEYK